MPFPYEFPFTFDYMGGSESRIYGRGGFISYPNTMDRDIAYFERYDYQNLSAIERIRLKHGRPLRTEKTNPVR